jgi:hypothetical protein
MVHEILLCVGCNLKLVIFFQVDVSADIAYVMAPKEEPELLIMKKACIVSVDVFNKYLKDQIMEIIDSDKVSRFSLSFLSHLQISHLKNI